jgi:hypothetical protein
MVERSLPSTRAEAVPNVEEVIDKGPEVCSLAAQQVGDGSSSEVGSVSEDQERPSGRWMTAPR